LSLDPRAVDGGLGWQTFLKEDGIDHGAFDSPLGIAIGLNAVPPRADRLLGEGAAAESPGVADVFGGGDFFDASERREFGPEDIAEVVVVFFFVGLDAVVGCEQSKLSVVAGGLRFAVFGFRAGGCLRVGAVGVDLSFCCH